MITIPRTIVRHKTVFLIAFALIGLVIAGSLLVVNSHTSVSYNRVNKISDVSVTVPKTINSPQSIPTASASMPVSGVAAKSVAVTAPVKLVKNNQQPGPGMTDTTASNVATSASNQITSSSSVSTISTGITNDYPVVWANAKPDTIIDTWGMLNRESVSYTAWKVNETFGTMPTGWDNGVAGCYPSGFAKCWIDDAQASGIPTGMNPMVHSVGINTSGSTGFSAWIESVSGTNVTYSSYNCDGSYNFCTNTVPSHYFNGGYIYFAK